MTLLSILFSCGHFIPADIRQNWQWQQEPQQNFNGFHAPEI
jgi:hypothetical protein